MQREILTLLGLSLLGSVAGLVGGIIFLVKSNWARGLASRAVPFAAGVLLAVSFLDLLPEAVEEYGPGAFVVILFVFVGLFLVERFLFLLHHHNGEDEHGPKTAVPLVIFGDTIHNFLDGVAIAAAYQIAPSLGLLVALATFLHETPHEIADFAILLSAGWEGKKAFLANFFSALATIPGVFLTYFFAGKIEGGGGFLLALAAGLFLYVASTDFLPQAKHDSERSSFKNVLFLILGILAIVAVRVALPEIGR